MIGGIYRRGGAAVTGLDAVAAALPGREANAHVAWEDGAVGLVARFDPEGPGGRAARPMHVERAAGLAAVASARLDDRDALCDALGVPRPQRAGLPDSALVLRAYERWGGGSPGRLLGDFAFAVWDGRRRTLFCARDHVGTRPLFYCLTPERIVFASDIASVLAAPGVSGDLDETAVAAWLTGRNPAFDGGTLFRAVGRLPAGHTLAVGAGSVRVERWWRPEDVPALARRGDDAVAEALLDVVGRAVADRVRDGNRIGVHLSGGLDSSAVAVLTTRAMRSAGRDAPLAFCWQPPPGDGPQHPDHALEHRLIESVRLQEGLQVVHCPLDGGDLVAYLRRDGARDLNVHPGDEPVQRAAERRGVRVLLSGWGGDEGISFNGRGYWPELLRGGRAGTLWRELRTRSRRPLAALLLRAALPLVSTRFARISRTLGGGTGRRRRRSFIDREFAREMRLPPPDPFPCVGVRRVQLHLLCGGHLGERMDGWDVGGARHGIEYRYPLLDRRVLEFALGLPGEQYRRGPVSRWAMRHALGSILPDEVCWNPDKRDPARLKAVFDAIFEALPAVRTLIAARSGPPSRSRYIDMPLLLRHLDTGGHGRDSQRRWRWVRTLRFLDF